LALFLVFGFIAGGFATWFDPQPTPDERSSYALGATLGGLIPAMILLQIGYSLKNQRRLLKLNEQA
jgi:hypothetical protein